MDETRFGKGLFRRVDANAIDNSEYKGGISHYILESKKLT